MAPKTQSTVTSGAVWQGREPAQMFFCCQALRPLQPVLVATAKMPRTEKLAQSAPSRGGSGEKSGPFTTCGACHCWLFQQCEAGTRRPLLG